MNLKNGLSVKTTSAESHVRCLRLSALRNGKINCLDSKPIPKNENEIVQYLVKDKDVFIVRGNGSKDLVGRAGIVEETQLGIIFPDLFIRIPLDIRIILPEFFVAWWNSKTMRDIIVEAAKTTSGIWKINQGHIASFSVPLLGLEEQHRIVAYLDGMQSKLDALKRHQADTAAELEALLPAVLERAFRGEL
jgi:type I restriction enzyme S subunit